MKADARAKPMTPAQVAEAVAELTAEPAAAKAEREKLEKFVDDTATKYAISDRKGLLLIVKVAKSSYSSSPLSKRDARQLRNAIPKVTEVLFRPGNEARIASLLMNSDYSRIDDGPYDPVVNGKIIVRTWEIRTALATLERALRQQPRKNDKIKLHGVVAILERYADKNKVKGNRKFIERIVNFIDPDAVDKLPSVMKHRLKRPGQNRAKKDGKLS